MISNHIVILEIDLINEDNDNYENQNNNFGPYYMNNVILTLLKNNLSASTGHNASELNYLKINLNSIFL